ncbi:hypothetical protein QBC39DRAFT_335277 [Podospora conica]|nr:hypothetical protein QBC39DRAFT_335277 [Schizothecium conicum]
MPYPNQNEAAFKVLTKILQPLDTRFKVTPALRCKGASYRRYGYRSNYLRLIRIRLKVKEYTDPKSILRAYLTSPKKNALRSTTRKYFEENDGRIYKPPFPTGRFKGSSLAKYEGRKPEYLTASCRRVAYLIEED